MTGIRIVQVVLRGGFRLDVAELELPKGDVVCESRGRMQDAFGQAGRQVRMLECLVDWLLG